MDSVQSRVVHVNGIMLRVYVSGTGPLVVLCHGWPELAYSWRHQFEALTSAGYRVIAPDMRGYGGSAKPQDAGAYAITDLVADMVALVHHLGESRACIVGHDWGANVAWAAALMRPDIFVAVVGLSVPHRLRNPDVAPLAVLRAAGMENFYWFHFNREGVAESELEKDMRSTLRRILFTLSGDVAADHGFSLMLASAGGFLDQTIDPEELPPWLSDEDLDVYVDAFRTGGMRGPLNWYRNYDNNWKIMAPFQGAKILVPTLFIAGTRDLVITSSIGSHALEAMSLHVPKLRGKVLIEGGGHWIQQERPGEVNQALLAFLAEDYPS